MLPLTVDSVLHKSEIPELPGAYRRLVIAVDAQDQVGVVEILREDAAFAELLLSLANSPLFQFPAPLGNVDEAAAAIGHEQVRYLMLGAVVVRMLGSLMPDIVSAKSFWRHNVACGIVARNIAAQREEPNIESFFLAGMLHDIGSLFLYRHISEQNLIQLLHSRDVCTPLFELEREVLGFDHAALSGALAREWGLPEAVCAGVANHHAPGSDPQYRLEEALLHVADLIAVALECGSSGEYCVPPLVPEAWDMLGLSVADLPALVEQVDRQLDAACELFLQNNAVRVDAI